MGPGCGLVPALGPHLTGTLRVPYILYILGYACLGRGEARLGYACLINSSP